MQAVADEVLFGQVRRVRGSILVLYAVLHTSLIALCLSDALYGWVTLPLFVLTEGVVTYTLLAGVLKAVLLVGGLVFWMGRLRPGEIGLVSSHLANALVITAFLWAVVQFATALIGQVSGAGLRWNPELFFDVETVLLGRFLEAVFGSALVEEVLYRGFLLPQLYLLAGNRWPGSRKRRLLFALAASQVYFGLNHIPSGLEMDLPAASLLLYVAAMAVGGVFFAAIFLTTGNLFLAVGVHALVNHPFSLFISGIDPPVLVLALAVLLLMLWPLLMHPFGKVFTLRPVLAAG